MEAPVRREEPGPSKLSSDEEFLDEALDLILEAWNDGVDLPIGHLLARRPDLASEIESVVRMARASAVQSQRHAPRIGGYELHGLLGRGGMGSVYLASQPGLSRSVALKVCSPHVLTSASLRHRFQKEARTLAALSHPNIVVIHDVVEAEGVAGYAMEWIDGPTLASVGSLEVSSAIRIAVAILRALGVVHRAGLVHRDVSPRNVLLRRTGEPVLTDFGIVQDADAGILTGTGEFLGTPAYAAPEQIRGDQGLIGPATDQYSVGVMLFELVFGRLPFGAPRDYGQHRLAMETGSIRFPRQRPPAVPRDLDTVLERALAPNPEDRYKGADEFADDLERILSFRPITAKRSSMGRRLARWCRRNRPAVLAAGLATVIVTFLALAAIGEQARRADLPARVAEEIRHARLALLDPEIGSRLFFAFATQEKRQNSHPRVDLGAALKHYARARAMAPDDRDLATEEAVVLLAHEHRIGHLPTRPKFGWIRYPLTRMRATGTLTPMEIPGGDPEDRRTLGLLGYLIGDASVCVAAWDGMDMSARRDPLIDGVLGDLYLSRGLPAPAYPRLLRAFEAFPESGHLALSAADSACQVGDVAVARRILSHCRRNGLDDVYGVMTRIEADLLAAEGELSKALSTYPPMTRLTPGGKRSFARLLARSGDREGAVGIGLELANQFPLVAEFSIMLLGHGVAWWRSLSTSDRIDRIARGLDPTDPGLLARLLLAWPRLERAARNFPESATNPARDPTREDGWAHAEPP